MAVARGLLVLWLLLGASCSPMPTEPRPAVTVSGRIVDQLGRAVSTIIIVFSPRDDELWDGEGHVARTDGSGSYSLSLVPGRWAVQIYPPSHVAYSYEFEFYDRTVEVSAGASRFDFTLVGHRVTGTVIAPTGSILDSGFVFASVSPEYDVAGTSFRGGGFLLFLPPGAYDFRAYPKYPLTARGHLRCPGHRRYHPSDHFRGRSGLGHGVRARRPSPWKGPVRAGDAAFLTDPAGSYTLYLPHGTYRFRCDPGTGDEYILPRITLPLAISGPTALDFDLSGVEWTGTVRSSVTGSPLDSVLVSAALFGDSFGRSAVGRTDGAGQFRLVLEPGRDYVLTLESNKAKGLTYPGIVATADSTFDILLDPLPSP